MRVMSADEIWDRFESDPGSDYTGLRVNRRDYLPYLSFNDHETAYFVLPFPGNVHSLPFHLKHLTCLGYEEAHFDGAYVWFSDFSVGEDFIKGIGLQTLEAIHIAEGQPADPEVVTGHYIRPDERFKACGLLIQAMVFGWDAYYLPMWSWGGGSDFFLKVSHHDEIIIETKTEEFRERVLKELLEAKYALRRNPDGQYAHFPPKKDQKSLE